MFRLKINTSCTVAMLRDFGGCVETNQLRFHSEPLTVVEHDGGICA